MAGLSHTFSCTVADGTNTALVRPSDWNAGHLVGAGTSAYGLIPIGGVVNWAGLIANVPAGWLVCDGTEYSTTTYANLYAAIGAIFGSGTGTFKVPDLRDKFVVGANQDSSGVPKANIRGSLEQSITATGITLTHNGSIANHTGLTHGGASVGNHPDLTHAAISIADHPSTSMTIGVGAHATATHRSVRTSAGNSITAITSFTSTHAVTGATQAAITHNVSAGPGTHVGTTYGTHAITQADAHGTAGAVTHSFTAPSDHTSSIVPAFLAMAFIIRYQ